MLVRPIRIVSSIVAVLAFFGNSATRAGVVAQDSFSYPDGDLWGLNGGSGWTAGWTGFLTNVTGGEAVGAGSPEFQAVRGFNYTAATSEMFVSLVLRTPANFGNDEFLGVFLLSGVNGSSLAMGKTLGDNHFVVGNAGFAYSDIPALPNTTYHLVGVTDLDQSRVALWVNPDASDFYDPATGANSADVSSSFSLGSMDRICVWGTEGGTAFDDILLGDTPQSVGLLSSAATGVGETAGFGGEAGWTTASPNPCRDTARFRFNLPIGGAASLAMFDVNGRLLEEAALGERTAGAGEHVWSASKAPAGVYFYEVRVDGARPVKGKLVVAR